MSSQSDSFWQFLTSLFADSDLTEDATQVDLDDDEEDDAIFGRNQTLEEEIEELVEELIEDHYCCPETITKVSEGSWKFNDYYKCTVSDNPTLSSICKDMQALGEFEYVENTPPSFRNNNKRPSSERERVLIIRGPYGCENPTLFMFRQEGHQLNSGNFQPLLKQYGGNTKVCDILSSETSSLELKKLECEPTYDEKTNQPNIRYENFWSSIDLIPPVFFIAFNSDGTQKLCADIVHWFCLHLKQEIGDPMPMEVSRLMNSTGATIQWQLHCFDYGTGYETYFLVAIMLRGIVGNVYYEVDDIFVNDLQNCFKILQRIKRPEYTNDENIHFGYVTSHPDFDLTKLARGVDLPEDVNTPATHLPIESCLKVSTTDP